MRRKTLLVAAIAASLALGSAAAFADTAVEDAADTSTEAPAIAVQTQTQTRVQVQDPELMGTDDAPMVQVQTRQMAQVHDPAEMGIDPPMTQTRAELKTGTATQAGDLTQDRDRLQVQDPTVCDGECDGNGVGDGTGECDEPINLEAGDGSGNHHGQGDDAKGGHHNN